MASATKNARDIFLDALERAPAEWAAYLDQACGEDAILRQRVEALLRAHEEPGAFLSEAEPDAGATVTHIPPAALAGNIIAGRYILAEKIGEGGMGEVWVARQTEPVKRKVALKLIRPGMDSKAVLSRFEQERQALALMDHPNIARVLDGGLTPDGRPFFVMELVNGLQLNRFCDEARLTPRERLELFVPICQAVQHAHQKGIIHRDLKPANVLVTIIDGRPVPKVIDFGVAKATAGKLTDESLSTQFGSVVGTLEYMAPEQAGYAGEDIDTRADIYSLGVILYELLTGLRPLDAKRFKQSAWTEMVRILREEEPSKPSTRLSTEESLPSLASLRQTEPKKLMALLRGELDWVVMKCLEKQRDRRYETANGLVRDIQRYLADEPVEARPPSARYRLSKFLRRNKGPVLATSLVLLALVAGMVGTTLGMLNAMRAQSREAEQRDKAEKARDRTRQALDAMTSSVTGDSLSTQKTLSEEQKKFLSEVLTYYKEFAGEQAEDESSKARTAEAAYRVGQIEYRLGRYEEGMLAFRQACDGYKELADEFPAVPAYREALAKSQHDLGCALDGLGKQAEAEQQYRKAVALREELTVQFPAVVAYRQELAMSHNNLGGLLAGLGKHLEAERQLRNALILLEIVVAECPDLVRYRQQLVGARMNLGTLLLIRGKHGEAEQQFRDVLALEEKLVTEFPTEPQVRRDLAFCHDKLGHILETLGNPSEAEEQRRKALPFLEKLIAEFPSVADYRDSLAYIHTHQGDMLLRIGKKRAEAEQEYRKATTLLEKLVADFPKVPKYQISLGGIYCNLGKLVSTGDQPDAGLAWFDKAIHTLTIVYDNNHSLMVAKHFLGNSYANRAFVYARLQRYAEAVPDWNRAIELSHPQQQPGCRASRATSRVQADQIVEAVAEVAELTKSSNWSAAQWYDFACVLALASGKSTDKKQEYAKRAMNLLHQAVKAGWKDAAHLKRDSDLDPLREREDFKTLIHELEDKTTSEREKQPGAKGRDSIER